MLISRQKVHCVLSVLAAFALALSLNPACAYATSPGGGTEGSDPAPEVPIIDVTVPVSFVLGGDAGLDIQQLGEVQASAEFVNNSNTAVRIKEATCDAAGLNSYFQVNDGNKATFSLVDKQVSWVPSESQGAQSIYTEESESLGDGFVLGRGANKDCSLALDMTGMGLKDAVIEATKERTELRNLMKISWTFERALGSATEQSDFYLKINDEPTHEALTPYKGLYLSLDEVKIMAEDLSDRGSDSAYFNMFKAMVGGKLYKQTEADPTQLEQDGEDIGDASDEYTCKVIWGDTQYDVRIIDVLHDTLSDGTGKAGLTFQFVNLLDKPYPVNTVFTNEGGWGQTSIRANMNPDDLPNKDGVVHGEDTNFIWNTIPDDQKQAFKTVEKHYSTKNNSTEGDLTSIDDKLFIPSIYELVGCITNHYRDDTWIASEGYQYAFYHDRIENPNGDNSSLVKKENGSAIAWASRSLDNGGWIPNCMMMVSSSGNLSDVRYVNNGGQRYSPMFCI